MLGRFASMIPVPNEHDFGIDYYCLPRQSRSSRAEMPVALCGIQVKGPSGSTIRFGGKREGKRKGTWRNYELDWLRGLRIPFYLAVVDSSFERVDMYSITRCLQVFWKTSFPFEIACEVLPPQFTEPVETGEPQGRDVAPGITQCDGKVWDVSLGSPFLSLKFKELVEESSRIDRCNVLLGWIEADRYSLENLSLGVPKVKLPQKYLTNEVPSSFQEIMFWNPSDLSRARFIAERIAPGITSLVKQILSQDRLGDAQKWKGALTFLLECEVLDQIGKDVLSEL